MKGNVLFFKGRIENNQFIKDKNCESPLIHIDNIKLTIEWLKKELYNKRRTTIEGNVVYDSFNVHNVINEAFQDVTK